MEWVQGELFDWDAPDCFLPKKIKRQKIKVDYKKIYEELKKKPLTYSEIRELAGTTDACTSQVIVTLSLHYPIYEYAHGVYKLYGDDDYGDGINHEALKKLLQED